MNRSFVSTLALTFAAIAVLFTIDTFLAKTERAEDRAQASQLFAEGERMVGQGRYADAISRLSDAVSIQRDNREYRLALADAYLAAGRSADAEAALNELLQEDSTDGAANLAMARVLLKEDRTTDAISFYHRAIYGHWKDQAMENRVRVRFELVDLLARQDAKADLLAELLPLQEEAPDDLQTRQRIGRLFISAGSSSHAAEVFQDILRRHPQDADAYAGLGAAEAARGNYQTARIDYSTAAHLKPQDDGIRGRLELIDQVLELDPTQRGLDTRERYRRSLKLLQLTLDDVKSCAPAQADPAQSSKALLDTAAETLKLRVAANGQNEAAENNLDLAEQLWQLRRTRCPPPPADVESPLALVLAKIGS
jgi:Flp pilus assembly protein TadD